MKNKIREVLWMFVLVLFSFSCFAYNNISVKAGYNAEIDDLYSLLSGNSVRVGYNGFTRTYRSAFDFNISGNLTSDINSNPNKIINITLVIDLTGAPASDTTLDINDLDSWSNPNVGVYPAVGGANNGNDLLARDIGNQPGAYATYSNIPGNYSDNFNIPAGTTHLVIPLNASSEINLISPQDQSSNNTATTPVTTLFKFNATDDSTINNCTLNLGNGTTIAISSISTTNSYSINLANGTYQWNVSCIDSYDNTNTSLTRTYYVNDSKAPDISSLGSSTTTTSSTITWTTNEKANATVYYSTSNTDVRTNIATSTSFITSQSLTISSLSSSTTYYYNASSCDELNNCNSTGVNSFTTASSEGYLQ